MLFEFVSGCNFAGYFFCGSAVAYNLVGCFDIVFAVSAVKSMHIVRVAVFAVEVYYIEKHSIASPFIYQSCSI